MKEYTDQQLKLALAKMLPEQIRIEEVIHKTWTEHSLFWNKEVIQKNIFPSYTEVLDTEILHLCWMVEEAFNESQFKNYDDELQRVVNTTALSFESENEKDYSTTHATWQQRTLTLAATKGIEIV